jgi:SAM-dependent methyltransferase
MRNYLDSKIRNIYQKTQAAIIEGLPLLSPVVLLKREIPDDAEVVLDIGCGKGTSLFVELAKCKNIYLIGVDLFLPSLIEAKKIFNDVILADARYLPFKQASSDIIVSSQVIEHLDKGILFINSLQEISKKKIMITVPVGSNLKHDLEDGNPYQAHKSFWYPEEFKRLGFQVYGCEGARFLRSEQSRFHANKNFYLFFYFFGIITQFLTYKLVTASYQMLCIKQLNKQKNLPRQFKKDRKRC